MKLFPHQEAGVQWLLANPRGGLFDDQGLGKTAQVIVAADRLTRDAWRILVVCPTVVAHNWKREIEAWAPYRQVQVVTEGRAKIHRDDRPSVVIVTHGLLLKEPIQKQLKGFDLIVLDEAHFFRNPGAQRTRIFYSGPQALCRQAPRCWVLTGTPMPNNPSELYPMLAGLAPHRLRDERGTLLSFTRFRDRFCVTEQTEYGIRVIGAKNQAELRQRLQGFALRRMKGDVLDLPPIRFGTVALTAEDAVRDPGELQGKSADEVLAEMQANAPGFSTWRRLCGLAKVDAAVELLKSDLESGMQKAVVFYHHVEVGHRLGVGLAAFNPVSIHGGSTPERRQLAVDHFQNNPSVRVCVAQLTAGGIGVTLTAASDVVFVEQSFVPGDNAQAADRCHRIGQTKPVLVRFLSLAGSVDEVLTDILARKTQMIREVLS